MRQINAASVSPVCRSAFSTPMFKVFIGNYNARNMFIQDTIQNTTKHAHKKHKPTQFEISAEANILMQIYTWRPLLVF